MRHLYAVLACIIIIILFLIIKVIILNTLGSDQSGNLHGAIPNAIFHVIWIGSLVYTLRLVWTSIVTNNSNIDLSKAFINLFKNNHYSQNHATFELHPEEYYFSIALKEIEINKVIERLWVMALAYGDGNEEKAKSYYIRERSKQLKKMHADRLSQSNNFKPTETQDTLNNFSFNRFINFPNLFLFLLFSFEVGGLIAKNSSTPTHLLIGEAIGICLIPFLIGLYYNLSTNRTVFIRNSFITATALIFLITIGSEIQERKEQAIIEKGLQLYKEKNYTEAYPLFLKAAEQGQVKAQGVLASFYYFGTGVPKDSSKATYWFTKAAEQGDATAQYFLGTLEDDDSRAAYWYRQAADQGHVKAQTMLGGLYKLGSGVPKDHTQAVYWFTKAAEKKYAKAQLFLGNAYADGDGVTKDNAKATYWYRKAAEQNETDAQVNLSTSYIYGDGVSQDYNQAMYWLSQAAEHGHAEGQYRLGMSYFFGEITVEDDAKAIHWLRKAAQQGHKRAINQLKDIGIQ